VLETHKGTELVLKVPELRTTSIPELQQGVFTPLNKRPEKIKLGVTIHIKNPEKVLDQANLTKIIETIEHLGGEVIFSQKNTKKDTNDQKD
jgi:hypothetical protein